MNHSEPRNILPGHTQVTSAEKGVTAWQYRNRRGLPARGITGWHQSLYAFTGYSLVHVSCWLGLVGGMVRRSAVLLRQVTLRVTTFQTHSHLSASCADGRGGPVSSDDRS